MQRRIPPNHQPNGSCTTRARSALAIIVIAIAEMDARPSKSRDQEITEIGDHRDHGDEGDQKFKNFVKYPTLTSPLSP